MTKMSTTKMVLPRFDLTRQAWTLSICHALHEQELLESSLHDFAVEGSAFGAVAPDAAAAAAAALVAVDGDGVVVAAGYFGCGQR